MESRNGNESSSSNFEPRPSAIVENLFADSASLLKTFQAHGALKTEFAADGSLITYSETPTTVVSEETVLGGPPSETKFNLFRYEFKNSTAIMVDLETRHANGCIERSQVSILKANEPNSLPAHPEVIVQTEMYFADDPESDEYGVFLSSGETYSGPEDPQTPRMNPLRADATIELAENCVRRTVDNILAYQMEQAQPRFAGWFTDRDY